MLKQHEATRVNYDGIDFAIFPFPAMKAACISGDLVKFLTPIIGALVPAFKGGTDAEKAVDSLLNMSMTDVTAMLQTATTTLDSETIDKILSELLIDNGNVSCEYRDDKGKMVKTVLTREVADEIFVGSLDSMLLLAVDVVKLNYGDFFTRLLTQSGGEPEGSKTRTSKTTGRSKGTTTIL